MRDRPGLGSMPPDGLPGTGHSAIPQTERPTGLGNRPRLPDAAGRYQATNREHSSWMQQAFRMTAQLLVAQSPAAARDIG